MPAYLIIQIKFTAPKERFAAYRDAVGPLAAEFGGRYLVAGAAKVDVLEGSHDGRSVVIFEFPSMDALHAFWTSPSYGDVKRLREGLADLDIWAVPGFEAQGS
jgi:uncharacterized protein (DUF1330 family)